jgi:hypothetical protein
MRRKYQRTFLVGMVIGQYLLDILFLAIFVVTGIQILLVSKEKNSHIRWE